MLVSGYLASLKIRTCRAECGILQEADSPFLCFISILWSIVTVQYMST